LRGLVFYAALAAACCLLAGTWRWANLWWVLGTQSLLGLLSLFMLSDELVAERMKPGGRDQDEGARRIVYLFVGQLVVCALDAGRLHWGDSVPPWLVWLAYCLHVTGFTGVMLSMYVNRFFSSAVRMQHDRGQVVVDRGPYRLVRHPGYLFGALFVLGQGLALGSWCSLVPGVWFVAELVRRTLLEDSMLMLHLEGYEAYAERVPYRLIPGVW
jgi:protein-S-isoprenylcysteine O-methyltransferase Ste14